MGEKENKLFQLSFNGFLKIDFQGSRVTFDSGLLLVRELHERSGLAKLIDEHLTDLRQGTNKKFALAYLLRQLGLPSRSLVQFYNRRGTAEQWIKEGKQATSRTRLSCHRFRANDVRLQVSVLTYNLGNLWRRLGLPRWIKSWSLTSLQHRLMKTGGRLIKHARYYWLLLAEGHLNRKLFGPTLGRLAALSVPGG